jgi:hypothetical protein
MGVRTERMFAQEASVVESLRGIIPIPRSIAYRISRNRAESPLRRNQQRIEQRIEQRSDKH